MNSKINFNEISFRHIVKTWERHRFLFVKIAQLPRENDKLISRRSREQELNKYRARFCDKCVHIECL